MPCRHRCKNKATCAHACCKRTAAPAPPSPAPEHALRRFANLFPGARCSFVLTVAILTVSALKSFGGQEGEIQIPFNPCVDDPELQLFNRKQEAELLRTLIGEGPMVTINGPPSSGKSTLIPRVIANMSNGAPTICLDLRAEMIQDYETLIGAFRQTMQASSTWATAVSKLSKLANHPAVDREMAKSISWWPMVQHTAEALKTFGEDTDVSRIDDPMKIINAWRDAIRRFFQQTGKKVIIYIDELSMAKGDSRHTAEDRGKMDHFIEALEQMFVLVTKQKEWALVVQTTSDHLMRNQLNRLRLDEASFSDFVTLGYMAKSEVLAFLEHAGINNESLRLEVFNFAGGHFTLLKKIATRFRSDGVDGVLKMLTYQTSRVKDRLRACVRKLPLEMRKNFTTKLAVAMLDKPQPLEEVVEEFGADFVERVVEANLVQIRQPRHAILQPDLEIELEAESLTFFSPVHAAMAKEFVKKNQW
eukprot:CAMPEP_0174850058 /NCGR_PEP_ID=MMETSP1114-20130205/18861_1 /TAXON_ID=312471 /ORGANISM="Neobodo designis, Strain CCAP 1951/1" /LENGTH=474 /DNA_ID=CAMNT_0016084485 /DNA_START=28 /DNA_END=1449 /DNA_ORIENTATION=-